MRCERCGYEADNVSRFRDEHGRRWEALCAACKVYLSRKTIERSFAADGARVDWQMADPGGEVNS